MRDKEIRRGRWVLTLAAGAMLLAGLAGSTSAAQVAGAAVVTFQTADGATYRTLLANPADVVRAEKALAGDGYAGVPSGTVARGDGGINLGHDWHVEGTEFLDATIELCDATVSYIDENLDAWIEEVGTYCPWSAIVVAVEPIDGGTGEASITIHKALCPAGYAGETYFEDCHGTPLPGISFSATATGSGTTVSTVSGLDGVGRLALSGAELPGTVAIDEVFPPGTERFVVYCSTDDGATAVPFDRTAAGIVLSVKPGAAILCDWYNVPAAAGSMQPGGEQPGDEIDDQVRLPNTGTGAMAAPTNGTAWHLPLAGGLALAGLFLIARRRQAAQLAPHSGNA